MPDNMNAAHADADSPPPDAPATAHVRYWFGKLTPDERAMFLGETMVSHRKTNNDRLPSEPVE